MKKEKLKLADDNISSSSKNSPGFTTENFDGLSDGVSKEKKFYVKATCFILA